MDEENNINQEPVEIDIPAPIDKLGISNDKQKQLVYEALSHGRRVFGSSGASLTHQVSDPDYQNIGIDSNLAQVGLDGEHKTSKIMRDWIKDKPNVVIVDSVHIKGAGKEEVDEETGALDGGDTDHVVIVGNYIILVDSKNWKGKKRYNVTEKGTVTRMNKSFSGGQVHTMKSVMLWQRYLAQFRPTFNAIICITSDDITIVRDRNWWKQSFKLVSKEELVDLLDKFYERIPQEQKEKINTNLVSDVVIQAIKPYNVVKEKLGEIASLLD